MHASAPPTAPHLARLLRLARRLALGLVLVATSLGATGCSTGYNPVSGNNRALGYSWEEERQLGEQADTQIQQQYGVYQNDNLGRYVTTVGERVLQKSHLREQARPDLPSVIRNTPFTFRVLDSEVPNAFALPGGYVYLTRGLLAHLTNEAQMAMVLGHEVAHVAGRHSSQRAARQQIQQGLLVAGAVGASAAGISPGSVLQLGGAAAQLLSLSYSRDMEREADRLGVDYAGRQGYKASEGAGFFEALDRLQVQSGRAVPEWQSTHPDPGNRRERIRELARELARQIPTSMETVDQGDYYNLLDGLVLGANPRKGFVEGDTFYHPELAFRFPVPGGYQVVNQASFVALVEEQQRAQMIFALEDAASARAAAGDFASQQGLQGVNRGQRRFNGFTAETVLAEAQAQQGQRVRLLAYFFAYDGTVYSFKGLSAASTYDTYGPVFRRTFEGFDRLTDQGLLDTQPVRIRIVQADRSAPFRTFVDESNLPEGMTVEDLAILNQLGADERVEAGRPLKLPTQTGGR